ncbi:MAG: hypothetical protein QXQ95_08690 [Thermofilum sp.]|uniref:hypothetical protein n=1 Tax=Thermofilum sp. TaxID=1961369 RepID=UPI00316DBEC3
MNTSYKIPRRGWRTKLPYTVGELVRHILVEEGEANPLTLYKKVKETAESMGVKWFGSYNSMRRLVKTLKTLGLIEEVRRYPSSSKGLHEKVMYRLVKEKADAMAWRIPMHTLYPETIYGSKLYSKKKEEAESIGLTVSELAQLEHPEILMARKELGLPTPI